MNGLTISMEGMLKTGKADFAVAQSGISDLMFSRVAENRTLEIMQLEAVEETAGVLMGFYSIEASPFVVTWGAYVDDFPMLDLNIVKGAPYAREYDVIVGEVASKQWNKTIGDKVIIKEAEFTITGIYQTGSIYQDKGVTLQLSKLQEMQSQEGYVTLIYVRLKERANVEEVTSRIEEEFPDLVTIKSISELGKVDKGLETLDSATMAISLLAIVIGGIGVTNTIMMSVFERTREIGVLRAVGWTKRRILFMVLGESILLCVFSILIGSLLGVVGTRLLMLQPIIRGVLEPILTTETFARAIVVALAVGLIGGLYPAYRAAKLPPSEALRYE